MKDLLIKTLEQFELPVMQQGSLSEDEEYPETFFTFWNNAIDESSHYDNKANNYVWDFDLNVYSIDPERVNILLIEAKKKLNEVGFIVNGKGYDVASDEPSHTGRGIKIQKIE